MTASAIGDRREGARSGGSGGPAERLDRPLLAVGAVAACVVTASGLAVITLPVVVGWIAAPHAGSGLSAVLRTAAALWLVGHHVGFSFHGVGRIGLLPLGLVVLPGALLWRAGRWVVRAGGVSRLRHVGYAAVALAVPYAMLTGVLAVASRSAVEQSSIIQAVACGLVLALTAGGLGGARALAPWPRLIQLLAPPQRSLVVAVTGALAVLVTVGAALAGTSLAMHLHEAEALQRSLAPGGVGVVLLLLLELSYVPNAIVWGIAFALGPGFAFGSATLVSSTGSALGPLPAFPLLAALPPGLHTAMPGWLEPTVLAVPYLAGGLAGLLLVRAAPVLGLDAAPLWGLACGGVSGCLLALLAAASGGPLGAGRLAAVGPSPWQVGLISALEIGVSAAVTAGLANYVVLRRRGLLSTRAGREPRAERTAAYAAERTSGYAADRAAATAAHRTAGSEAEPETTESAHVIYLDPWAGDAPRGPRPVPRGPSSLPRYPAGG